MSTATGPQSPPPAPETEGPSGAAAPAPARRGVRGTWFDLIRTMIVVLAFVAVIVLLVPRPGQLPRPQVDVAAAAAGVQTQIGFTPLLPSGLPAGWTPTAAEIRKGTDGARVFHLNYITDGGLYAGVDQATSVSKAWIDVNDAGGTPVGTVTIDGVSWQQLYQQERQYTSLLLQRPGQVVLVTTKQGGVETASVLARALRIPPA